MNDGLGLVARIEKHLRQLAPHMMNREGVSLLREAKEEIELLQNMGWPEFSDGHDCEGFPGGCARFCCPGAVSQHLCTALPNVK